MFNNEKAYAAIEMAAQTEKPVLLPDGVKLNTVMLSSTKFLVKGLYWEDEDRNIYQAVLEVQFNSKKYDIAGLYVAGSCSLDGTSSSITTMFRKENRYKTMI